MHAFYYLADYEGATQTTITFPADPTSVNSMTTTVLTISDDVFEMDETFLGRLAEAVDNPNVGITRDITTVTINNDDSKSFSHRL